MGGFLESVKRAAVEAVRAEKPVGMLYGTVIGVNPLNVRVDQKLVLTQGQLILTNSVRTHKVTVTDAYGSCECFTVGDALSKGQTVILLRADGGQKYIILDRVEALT